MDYGIIIRDWGRFTMDSTLCKHRTPNKKHTDWAAMNDWRNLRLAQQPVDRGQNDGGLIGVTFFDNVLIERSLRSLICKKNLLFDWHQYLLTKSVFTYEISIYLRNQYLLTKKVTPIKPPSFWPQWYISPRCEIKTCFHIKVIRGIDQAKQRLGFYHKFEIRGSQIRPPESRLRQCHDVLFFPQKLAYWEEFENSNTLLQRAKSEWGH